MLNTSCWLSLIIYFCVCVYLNINRLNYYRFFIALSLLFPSLFFINKLFLIKSSLSLYSYLCLSWLFSKEWGLTWRWFFLTRFKCHNSITDQLVHFIIKTLILIYNEQKNQLIIVQNTITKKKLLTIEIFFIFFSFLDLTCILDFHSCL